jgi:hypothetical protein
VVWGQRPSGEKAAAPDPPGKSLCGAVRGRGFGFVSPAAGPGGLKSKFYTFSGNQFKSLKAFANLLPEMTQEAEEKLRKEFIPSGPIN